MSSLSIQPALQSSVTSSKSAIPTLPDLFRNFLQAATKTSQTTPPALESLSDYLTSTSGAIHIADVNQQAKNVLSEAQNLLQSIFQVFNVQNTDKIELKINVAGQLTVKNHPEKAKIEEILHKIPQLEPAIRQAMAMQKHAAILQQYEIYLEEFYKAYAEGGSEAANKVTDRYLGLALPEMEYAYTDTGIETRIDNTTMQNWRENTRRALRGE